MKMGGNAFALPDGLRNFTHPADDARMRTILAGLRWSGFQQDAMKISETWQEALRLTNDQSPPNYPHCYPEPLIDFIVEEVAEGVTGMKCRVARPDTNDPIHLLLNEAWRSFWQNPAQFQVWEAVAVKKLFDVCRLVS